MRAAPGAIWYGCGVLLLRSTAATGCCSCGTLIGGSYLACAKLLWAAIGEQPSCEDFRLRFERAVETSGRCKLHRWGHEPRQSCILLLFVSLNPCSQLLSCATHCTICTLLMLVHSHPLPPLWRFPFPAGTPPVPWNVVISRAPVYV